MSSPPYSVNTTSLMAFAVCESIVPARVSA